MQPSTAQIPTRTRLMGVPIAPTVEAAIRVWSYPKQDIVNPEFSALALPFGLPGDSTAKSLVPCQDGEGMILRISDDGEKSATILTEDDFKFLMEKIAGACAEAYDRTFLSGCVAVMSGKFHPPKLWIETFSEWAGECLGHTPEHERFGC